VDRLVLTAMRETVSGNYLLHDALDRIGERYAIDTVEAYRHGDDEIVDQVRKWENVEGVVVRFDDGHMIKIKADWYVRIHKVKSLLGQERDVTALILNNELDDLLPVLPKEDVERVEKFRDRMSMELRMDASSISVLVNHIRSQMDRKTFALEHSEQMNPLWKSMIFSFWDKEVNEHLTYAAIVGIILKHCGNNASYAKVKEAFLKDVDYV
jgi:RNA ligase